MLYDTEIKMSVRASVAHSVKKPAVGWATVIQELAVVFRFAMVPMLLLTAVVYAPAFYPLG